MLDPRYVADNLDRVRAALARRASESADSLDSLAGAISRRRELVGKTEALKSRRNAANQEMSALARGPVKAAFAARRDELKALSDEIKELEVELGGVEQELE